MSYTNLVTRKKKYKYSANICFDIKDEEKLAGFIPNITTAEILREYLAGIIDQSANVHSRILYGSYGTGKSHLLTVLSDILGHINTSGKGINEFLEALSRYDKDLTIKIKKFVEMGKPYLVVPIYAYFDEFDKCIIYSLKKELERNNINISFKGYFDDALKIINKWENGDESAKRLVNVCKANKVDLNKLCLGLKNYNSSSKKIFNMIFRAMTYGAEFISESGNLLDNILMANKIIKNDYKGIVFIFDEFGRFVEDSGENIRVKDVQDLAEFCDHLDFDDYLILVSHKQLSLYTDKMKKGLSDEWKKIEGRFKSTSINMKYDQCLSLIPHIIPKTKHWDDFKVKFEKQLNEVYNQAYDFKGFLLPSEEKIDFNPFEGAFPLHPITLFGLDRLSKKVAQNERTFFTYLVSDDDNALFLQLDKLDENEFHFVGLDAIYDYFEENICSYRSEEIKEIYKKYQVALNKLKASQYNILEIKILKSIAIIYIINDFGTLAPSLNTLINVINEGQEFIEMAIYSLEKAKIIKFMRQYGYYDFLDGSIYDFDTLIEEKILSVTDETAISILNEEFADFVIYPNDYNLLYHMNRIFLPIFALKKDINYKYFIRFLPKYYDGIVAFVLDNEFTKDEYQNIGEAPARLILVVNPNLIDILYEIKKYVSIKYYYSIREELMKNDPTVEKELSIYLEEQKNIIGDIILQWRKVKTKGIIVISEKKEYAVKSEKDLSELASQIMMNSFSDTIIINNSLINKNIISAAIKQAREKALSYIMNDDDILNNCSLLSPEHTILRSVLSKNGIYKDKTVGTINKLPSGEKSGEPVRREIRNYLKKCIKGQVLLNDLYDRLKRPPFGLRDGYISILVAYELRKYENVSIYFHGFEHEYCEHELLKALESPEEYSLYICDWTYEQSIYINSLEKLFATYINSGAKNRLKELFSAMNKHFIAISKAARTTDQFISYTAKQYREIMSITHKDYNQFFFKTLLEINSDLQELVIQIRNIIFELDNVTNLQIKDLEKIVRTVLNIDADISIKDALIKIYEENWKSKRFKTFDFQTSMLLNYLSCINEEMNDTAILQELGKIFTGFEIDYWNDAKIEEFYEELLKSIEKLDNYVVQKKVDDNEIKIIINADSENEKVTQIKKLELSGNSQIMFNKMKATIDNFGQSIDYEEKIRVLIKLFSEII